jgi:HlyD family secretion protein
MRSIALPVLTALLLGGCLGNSKDHIEASGTIEGTDVNVGTEVAGKVLEVRADEGAQVRKADTLVIIDDTDYRIQLRQALANVEVAEAQYRLALEGSRKEDILQAEANLKVAESDYNRMKDLLATKTVTQKLHDDAYARYISAQQTYEKLVRGLRREEVIAARAKRDQAVAQADGLRKKVDDCSVQAPSDGIVTLRGIEPGELVGVGANVLRITYLERVKLTIYVNETELGRVRIGQKADVTVDSHEGRAFPGKVVYISPVAEFTPKNVQTKEERTKLVFGVKIEIENPDGALKPGLPADATIFTPESK